MHVHFCYILCKQYSGGGVECNHHHKECKAEFGLQIKRTFFKERFTESGCQTTEHLNVYF